ncbi:hypothetical protein D3C72_2094280 [compost metagenome]
MLGFVDQPTDTGRTAFVQIMVKRADRRERPPITYWMIVDLLPVCMRHALRILAKFHAKTSTDYIVLIAKPHWRMRCDRTQQ